ncbi:MAG TPA: chemotaxis protein CheR [Geobacteraceae bacterium]
MKHTSLSYTPAFAPEVIRQRLERLVVPGAIGDSDLERRCVRLDERFRVYASSAPHGLWSPGLVLTDETRVVSDLYLPLDEIRAAFDRLFTRALRFSPFPGASPLQGASCWLDILHSLQLLVTEPNPAPLLRRLMTDETFRQQFFFALFLPHRYGGSFTRYPGQLAFLRRWLAENRGRLAGAVRCLDAACGSGEGTYDIALEVAACGYEPRHITIDGTTLEPLELFAAAHAYFPHDPGRQEAFRRRIATLFTDGSPARLRFSLENLLCSAPQKECYDVVLCNGLLGGPMLTERSAVEAVVRSLTHRLAPGGILLAADRFHAGWRKKLSKEELGEMIGQSGLAPLCPEEGIGGVKN